MFQQKKNGALRYYEASEMAATGFITHGFSTRLGGCSLAPYHSLNMGIYGADALEFVQCNRRRFAKSLGIKPEQVVCGKQVHGTQIQQVTRADRGRGYLQPETAFADTDGLITNEPGVALLTCFADCVPVMFLDPVRKVIAVCHCGWRGTVARMAAKTAQRMIDTYSCNPNHILCAIGPSISVDAYEVDQPVLAQFRQAFVFAEQCIRQTSDTHGHLDLWQANRLQLMEIGLKSEHIHISGLCTAANQAMFFSHRASGGKTGRNGALIMLKECE